MKARNRKQKVNKKPPVTRQTVQKRIASLAKGGEIQAAIRLARGKAGIEGDPARRLVDQWQAVVGMEDHPNLLSGAPSGFYGRSLKRAAWETWNAVRRAVKAGDADFFLRMAAKVKESSELERDELAVHTLSEKLRHKKPDELPKYAKEIADKAGCDASSKVLRRISRLRKEYGMKGLDK